MDPYLKPIHAQVNQTVMELEAEGHAVPLTGLGGAVYRIGKKEVKVSLEGGMVYVTEAGRDEGWLKPLKEYILDYELSLY